MSRRHSIADHIGPRRGPGSHFIGAAPEVKDRRGIARWLWGYLKEYRGGLAGVLLLVAATTGLTLVGPYLIGLAIDRYIATGDLAGLARLAGAMVLAYVLASGGMWVQSVVMIRISQRVVRNIRRDLFDHLQRLSLRFFDSRPHGDLMSRLTNDTDMIGVTLANSITQMISSLLSVVGAGCIMFAMSWQLAVVGLITFPLVAISTRYIGGHTRQGFRDRQEALGDLNGIVEESITGQRAIKAHCHENASIEDFECANADFRRIAIKAAIWIGVMGPIMNLFRNVGLAVVSGTGAWMVVGGLTTLGTVAAMVNYADYFNRPLHQLAQLYGLIQTALAGADRVRETIGEQPEADDIEAVDLTEVVGEVEFDNVCFSYVEGTPVLSEVSFHASPGQTIALIGSTGAGKTTIINLLTRFYDIDSGSIRLDGRDIRSLKRSSLRKALGIVLQDTFLFTDTVRENIRYGRLDATEEEIEAAARMANAESFILHLPQGYDTVLSDAGSNLSQGQRQLLSIARALLADPAILILDEATSNVDTRTEIEIQSALRLLMQGRTSFIIAHRLHTIREADRILVMADGRIVESGSHAELMGKRGSYQEMVNGQYITGAASGGAG